MRRITTTPNYLPQSLRDGDVNDPILQNQLQYILEYGKEGISQVDLVYDFTKYPSGVKKFYMTTSGVASVEIETGRTKQDVRLKPYEKKVPRQVLNIVTNSFTTKPQVFLEQRYNINFEEF